MNDLVDRAVAVAASLELSRVPDEVQALAGLAVADSVAIGWAGAATPEMRALLRSVRADGVARETGRARIWGEKPLFADAASAAFLNGVAGTFPALDAVSAGAGHPAMHIVPAALAAAQSSAASGTKLLRAVVTGYEVAARLHGALRATWPAHENGHVGAVGAAVSAALVQDTDPLECARIAATMPLLSIWDVVFDGATARGAWFGHAARAGIEAARMARAGFKGSARALATAYGSIAGRLGNTAAAIAPLEYANLAVSRTLFKRHAACYLLHPALDALAAMNLPEPARVHRIVVEAPRSHVELERAPLVDNTLAGQFSLPYAVATAVIARASDFEAFAWRPESARLARRVEVVPAKDLEPWGARVTIETDSGRVIGESRGRPRPLAPEGVRERFRRQIGEPAELWWSRLTDLPALADCARLFESLD